MATITQTLATVSLALAVNQPSPPRFGRTLETVSLALAARRPFLPELRLALGARRPWQQAYVAAADREYPMLLQSQNVLRILVGDTHVYAVTDAGLDIFDRASMAHTGYVQLAEYTDIYAVTRQATVTCGALNGNGVYIGGGMRYGTDWKSVIWHLPLTSVSGDVSGDLTIYTDYQAISAGRYTSYDDNYIQDLDGSGAALLYAHYYGASYRPDSAQALEYSYFPAQDGLGSRGVFKCACCADHIALRTAARTVELPAPSADFDVADGTVWGNDLADDFHTAAGVPDSTRWALSDIWPGNPSGGWRVSGGTLAFAAPNNYPYSSGASSTARFLYGFSGDFDIELVILDVTHMLMSSGTVNDYTFAGLCLMTSGSSAYAYRAGVKSWRQNNRVNRRWAYSASTGSSAAPTVTSNTFNTFVPSYIRLTRSGRVTSAKYATTNYGTYWTTLFTHTGSSTVPVYYPTIFCQLSNSAAGSGATVLQFRVISGEIVETPPDHFMRPTSLRYDATGKLSIAAPETLDAISGAGGARARQTVAQSANDAVISGETIGWVDSSEFHLDTLSDTPFPRQQPHGGNVCALDFANNRGFVDGVWFRLPARTFTLPGVTARFTVREQFIPALGSDLATVALRLTAAAVRQQAYLLYRPHKRIWRLTLDDVELPISSFQLRLRESDNSYFNAVVPNAPAYAGLVAAHPGGQMRVYQGYLYEDGSEDLVLIAQAKLQNVVDSRGAWNRTLTLTGYGKAPAPGPDVETSSVSYTRVSDGVTNWRCDPLPQLAPGGAIINRDTGERLVASLITWYVSISGGVPSAQMEVSTGGME